MLVLPADRDVVGLRRMGRLGRTLARPARHSSSRWMPPGKGSQGPYLASTYWRDNRNVRFPIARLAHRLARHRSRLEWRASCATTLTGAAACMQPPGERLFGDVIIGSRAGALGSASKLHKGEALTHVLVSRGCRGQATANTVPRAV